MNNNSTNLTPSLFNTGAIIILLCSVILITISRFSISEELNPVSENQGSSIESTQEEPKLEVQSTFPINLNSDTTTMDGITREITNCGNARISQGDINLLADCIVAKKGTKNEYEYFEATGTPASLEIFDRVKKEYLFLSANRIFYDVRNQNFVATGSANLVLSSGKNSKTSPDRLNIKSNEITIKNESEKQRMIEAKGVPVNLAIRSEGNIELNAKSLYLSYSTVTNELNLLEKVEAELALGKITAGEFRYNHRTKQSSFKKAKGQQIEIVQNQKLDFDTDSELKSEEN
ncbi:MAG: hypothetical protein COB38_02820 [Gammaproteobacteria bacterium]|nr:MAG: hypothetical protein COB38_02820 [Gammaproteobacteria bacterium]